MQSFSSLTICFMGILFGVKAPKIERFFVMCNLSLPASVCFLHPRYSPDTFESIFVSRSTICSVLPIRCFSKIFKPIIRFISINMVNLFCGHFSSDIKPNKPMGSVMLPIDFNMDVSTMNTSGFLSNINSWSRSVPNKMATRGVVFQKVDKLRMRNHSFFYHSLKKTASIHKRGS